ncbi:hypothetical protein EON68_02615 [archaeon]|nr:MAG: hypothetical protein EON68_02615 [archaeon]
MYPRADTPKLKLCNLLQPARRPAISRSPRTRRGGALVGCTVLPRSPHYIDRVFDFLVASTLRSTRGERVIEL